jgi:xanthosine phosphorylase
MTQVTIEDPSLAAAARIKAQIGDRVPRVGIVLGSGLGEIASAVTNSVVFDYRELPGFASLSVPGHAGNLLIGEIGGVSVAVFQGRAHCYESLDPVVIRTPIRTLKALGGEMLLLTGAVGSLDRDIEPGSLVLVSDHINMMGFNPLVGPNDESIGPRFPNMRRAWDPDLRRWLQEIAYNEGLRFYEGVYAAMLGPNFETAAEIRMLMAMQADIVGMSMVPECIVARHCGLRVAGMAAVTNLAEGLGNVHLTHEETIRVGQQCAGDLMRIIYGFFESLS